MRVVARFLLFFVPVIGISIFGSLKIMEKLEQQWLAGDLDRRSRLISESIHEYVIESLDSRRIPAVTRLLNRMSRDERLTGALICSPAGGLIAKSDAVPPGIDCGDA